MKTDCLRWGFFGAGKCTHDFITALKLLSPEHHKPVAIASRDLAKAQEFTQRFDLERACGSYIELARSSDIDIIYIGTVNSEHYNQAKLSMEHGKNVLCEKPMCINFSQAKDLVDLAKRKNLFFMEGFWTFFFPAAKTLFDKVNNGGIGKVVHVIVEIGSNFHHLDRFRRKEIGGGSLINHGVYGIMFAYLLLGKPNQVFATGHLSNEGGIDHSATIILSYKEKAQLATILLTSRADMPGELKVVGTNGTVKLHFPLWAPRLVETPDGILKFDIPEVPLGSAFHFNNLNSGGFTYEAEEVRRCLQKGLLECPILPWEASLAVMKIADEARKQIGLVYAEDIESGSNNEKKNGH